MSSFIIERKKDYNYIVETSGHWDSQLKRMVSNKKYVGKVDKETNAFIFKPDFLSDLSYNKIYIKGQEINLNDYRQLNKGESDEYGIKLIDTNNSDPFKNFGLNGDDKKLELFLNTPLPQGFTYGDINEQKIIGTSYFIYKIAEKSNLLSILQETFKARWPFILNLLAFIIIKKEKTDYCVDFINDYILCPVKGMSSQAISNFFDTITAKERNEFYKKWIKLTKETEYLALDITSISSSSKKIDIIEFGHSKESNKLPQVNLCMLFGENSHLPMYQTIYSGSLTDVITLKTTLREFNNVIGDKNYKLVMDRGFYSQENLEFMAFESNLQFIIGVPFTTNYANDLVLSTANIIDRATNYIKTTSKGETIVGLKKFIQLKDNKILILADDDPLTLQFNSNKSIFCAFIYYNSNKALRDKLGLYQEVNKLKNNILTTNKILSKDKSKVDKFMTITYAKGRNIIEKIELKDQEIHDNLITSGYSILISNFESDPISCYTFYIQKDVVEKSFHNFKTHLGLDRPYVHGSKRLVNKSFIIFLCQILYSYIAKLMTDLDLYKEFTILKVFKEFDKIKLFGVKNIQFLRTLSKVQKKLLSLFKI